MKKISGLIAALALLPAIVLCQDKPSKDFVQTPTFGVHFFFHDFQTAANIRATSLSSTIRNKTFGKVKEFQKLADFLVRDDSARYHPDTLRSWIKRQEKHVVSGFQRVPIFIRYFSTEAKEGRLVFHEDIYGEDKALRERYFADKAML